MRNPLAELKLRIFMAIISGNRQSPWKTPWRHHHQFKTDVSAGINNDRIFGPHCLSKHLNSQSYLRSVLGK